MTSPTFGGFPFNANLWAGAPASVTLFSDDLVAFEGFSLSDGDSIICTDLVDSGPTRELITGNIPRGDGQYLNCDFWRQKDIEIRGFLKADTAEELDDLIDSVRKNLRTSEGALDVTRHGTARRFIATLTNAESLFADRQRFHITFCPFVARFTCKVPFGIDRGYTSFTDTLTSDSNLIATTTGTIEAQPVITLIFNSASSVTVVNVKRIDGVSTTLDEIEYAGSIAAGDILVFDSQNKIVTKNGVQVDFTGSFPILEPGSNIIRFDLTASSFDATVTVAHQNSYL